jgi:hypothetical protein
MQPGSAAVAARRCGAGATGRGRFLPIQSTRPRVVCECSSEPLFSTSPAALPWEAALCARNCTTKGDTKMFHSRAGLIYPSAKLQIAYTAVDRYSYSLAE